MRRTLLFIVGVGLATGIAMSRPLDAFPPSHGAEGFPAVLIWTVLPGGHAQECGLLEWDLITEIDGLTVDALGGPDSMGSWIREAPPGRVEVTYLRPSPRAGEFQIGSATCAVPGLDIHVIYIFVAGDIPPGSDAEVFRILPGDYIKSPATVPWVDVWRRNERWGEPDQEYMTQRRLTLPNP